jgi:DNA replication protein DnaC
MEQAVLEAQDLHTLPKLFRQWAIAPLLCLDELGELSGTDFARKNLTQLIDDRYGNRQPTLLAGNVSVSDIPGLIGLSAFDRLREVGGVIEFNWQSFRGMF